MGRGMTQISSSTSSSKRLSSAAANACKGIAFAALALALVVWLGGVLGFKYSDGIYQMELYYEQPEDTVDVLVVGSSRAFENVNTSVLWEDFGITSFNLCGSLQPAWNSYYYLKEALDAGTQSPQLVIYEAYILTEGFEYTDRSRVIKNNYGMRWGANRIDNLLASTSSDEEFVEFLFPLNNSHERYAELSQSDFLPYLGNAALYEHWKGHGENFKVTDYTGLINDVSGITEERGIVDREQEYFLKLVELTKERDIPLLVMVAPYSSITEYDQAQFNYVKRLCEEQGVPFVNFNSGVDGLELNPNGDYADEAHLSYTGNRKFTKALGEYLTEHYELTDRRADPDCGTWQASADAARGQMLDHELAEEKDQASFVRMLEENQADLDIVVAVGSSASDEQDELLASLGVQGAKSHPWTLWVKTRGGEPYRVREREVVDYGYNDLLLGPSSTDESSKEIRMPVVQYDGASCVLTDAGVNFFVYDHLTGREAASAAFDPDGVKCDKG